MGLLLLLLLLLPSPGPLHNLRPSICGHGHVRVCVHTMLKNHDELFIASWDTSRYFTGTPQLCWSLFLGLLTVSHTHSHPYGISWGGTSSRSLIWLCQVWWRHPFSYSSWTHFLFLIIAFSHYRLITCLWAYLPKWTVSFLKTQSMFYLSQHPLCSA